MIQHFSTAPKNTEFEGIKEVAGNGTGVILSDRLVKTLRKQAINKGADFHFGEEFKSFNLTQNGIKITTERGEYFAKKVIFTTGMWTKQLLSLPIEMVPIILYY